MSPKTTLKTDSAPPRGRLYCNLQYNRDLQQLQDKTDQDVKTARARAASRWPWSRAMPVSCSPRTYHFVIGLFGRPALGSLERSWSVLSSSWSVLSWSCCKSRLYCILQYNRPVSTLHVWLNLVLGPIILGSSSPNIGSWSQHDPNMAIWIVYKTYRWCLEAILRLFWNPAWEI